MTLKKIFPILIAALAVTAVIVGSKILLPKPMFQGDYPYYPDVQSLTEAADVIVVGEVVKAREVKQLMVDRTANKKDKETTPYTLSELKVLEVIKGDVSVGDIITVKQLGDYKKHPEKTLYDVDGYLKTQQKQLAFLVAYAESPYSAVNPAQGIVEVKQDGTLYTASPYSLFGYKDEAEKGGSDTLKDAIMKIKQAQ